MLEQRGDIGLIAGDSVEGLGQHYVEQPALCILQQRLDAGPQNHTRARDGGVVIGARDLPSLASGVVPAEAELVFD